MFADDLDSKPTLELPRIDGELLDDLKRADALEERRRRQLSNVDRDLDREYRGLDLTVDMIHQRMQQSCVAMLEIGLLMLQIKEHEGWPKLREVLDDQLQMTDRTARKWMQAALKVYRANRTALANLQPAKLLELMIWEDEELDELANGGTVADLALDDIDKMTVKELREFARKQREQIKEHKAIKERQLAAKDDRINELDAALTRREVGSRDEQVEAKLFDIDKESGAVCGALERMAFFLDELLTTRDREDLKEDEDQRWRQAVIRVKTSADRFLDEFMGAGFGDPDGGDDAVSQAFFERELAKQAAGES